MLWLLIASVCEEIIHYQELMVEKYIICLKPSQNREMENNLSRDCEEKICHLFKARSDCTKWSLHTNRINRPWDLVSISHGPEKGKTICSALVGEMMWLLISREKYSNIEKPGKVTVWNPPSLQMKWRLEEKGKTTWAMTGVNDSYFSRQLLWLQTWAWGAFWLRAQNNSWLEWAPNLTEHVCRGNLQEAHHVHGYYAAHLPHHS